MAVRKTSIQRRSDVDANATLTQINAKVSTARRFLVDDALTAVLQVNIEEQTGSGVTSIWTVKVSADGKRFYAHPDGAITLTAGGITPLFDVTGFVMLEISNSTVSTYTTEVVEVVVCSQR